MILNAIFYPELDPEGEKEHYGKSGEIPIVC